jgi:hypothetical protein
MSQPLIVSIPHRLGREEAKRRLQAGLGNAQSSFGQLFAVDEATWSGDTVNFRVRSLGQAAHGRIDVLDDNVRVEVTLPWLLAKMAERLVPAIRKEGTLLLEKK